MNKASRQTLSTNYFESMYNAEIVVTANPANWEGDFRLWEALASGALVFVDKISTPVPHPLLHEKNVIFYSTHNKSDFLTKLHYYLSNRKPREKIATDGYVHALRYHRTVNMVDYVLKSAHVKLLNQKPPASARHVDVTDASSCAKYTDCGQMLVYNLKNMTRML